MNFMNIFTVYSCLNFCELFNSKFFTCVLLQNIIGQEVGKSVIEEYLRRRGHSEFSTKSDVPTTTLHAYVKPPSVETSTSGSKKRTPKTVTVRGDHAEPNKSAAGSSQGSGIPATSNESRTSQKVNQVSSKKKKAGKTISLAEAAKGSIVFQQGRPCACQARRHNLVSNCLSCGKIVCEQEGEGPCNFCGALVLKEGSSYAGLEESLPPLSETEAAAEAYAKRLVDYDRNAAARTTVIDDQSDYYELDSNTWLSKEVFYFVCNLSSGILIMTVFGFYSILSSFFRRKTC